MIGDRKLLTKPSKPGDPSWDNENHDLILHTGDIIHNGIKKYSVISLLGRGTFGQVVNCIDQETEKNFAIKISKSPRIYYNCSLSESQILDKLKMQSPEYFVHIYSEFLFKQHHCIVLELLGRNLYEMLKISGFHGFPHSMVKHISKQLLNALIEMSKIGVVHCDLKPENILIEDPHTMKIKVIDFGSAFCYFKENCFYVQSRYYRAPEIIMNMGYNSSIDIWSFICVVFELYVGRPLFPGKSNSDQLARIFYLLEGISPKDKNMNENDTSSRDAFLSKEDVKKVIEKSSKSSKNNQNLYEFIFMVLKIRASERPRPAEIINHVYLSDTSKHGERRILEDDFEVIEARDQYHPPPQTIGVRRYTSSTMTVKNKIEYNRRKKSQFRDFYKPSSK